MAVTCIWPVRACVEGSIRYIRDPQKTTVETEPVILGTSASENSSSPEPVHRRLVTGINCTVEKATVQFKRTLSRKKTAHLSGYHAVQTFRSEEVDAVTAHRIGVELARQLWGDRFQAVVATHCNTDHLHNHIVLCGVSFLDGKLYKMNRENREQLKAVSDRLCEAYGLSVIREPNEWVRRRSYKEVIDDREGDYTVRNAARTVIDTVVRASTESEDFLDGMDRFGYILDLNSPRPGLRHFGLDHFIRFDTLGPGYRLEEIMERVYSNDYPEYPDYPEQDSPQEVFWGESKTVREMDQVDIYRCYVRAIEITVDRPDYNLHLSFLLEREQRRLERYRNELLIAEENRLETEQDLCDFREKTEDRMEQLDGERHEWKKALKRAVRKGDQNEIGELRRKIHGLSEQLKVCRKELKAADSIAERVGKMKEKLQLIERGKFRGKAALKALTNMREGRSVRSYDER